MSVYKRGDKWTARFRWRVNGKQQSISKTFATKEDAENWELERKIDRLQGVDKKLTKFLWLFDQYFDTYKKDYLRDSTKRQWAYVRKHFREYFGDDVTVQSIKLDQYQRFINSLNTKL